MALSTLYLYWLMGGKLGLKIAFHQNSHQSKRVKKPKPLNLFATLIVLITMTLITLAQTGIFAAFISNTFIRLGTWCIAIIFMLRAIGLFQYKGFTKQYNDDAFAKMDTYIYSPMCLLVAICALLTLSFF